MLLRASEIIYQNSLREYAYRLKREKRMRMRGFDTSHPGQNNNNQLMMSKSAVLARIAGTIICFAANSKTDYFICTLPRLSNMKLLTNGFILLAFKNISRELY